MENGKHVWPYPDIVKMTAHGPSGRWRKRHRGKDYYFGSLDDPDAALARWRDEWPRILSGGPQRDSPPSNGSVAVVDLCEQFLATKKAMYDRGELAWPTCLEYRYVAKKIIEHVGRHIGTGDLEPADFNRLLEATNGFGPTTRRNIVIKTRTIFKWAYDNRVISRPVYFGPDFKPPPAKVRRRHKREGGPRLLTPRQIHKLIELADPQEKALILLGINGGFGNNDAAHLRAESVDLKKGWIDQERQKTEAPRRVPLWKETVKAIQPFVNADRELLFINEKGRPLVRRDKNQMCVIMADLFNKAGITDRRFYDLRRTFATIAAEVGDDHASKIIMGHVIDGVHEGYVQRFPLKRLRKVTDRVHRWLYRRTKGSSA